MPGGTFTWLRQQPTFATKDAAAFEPLIGARVAIDLGFWTEAALLANAGVDAVVIGPAAHLHSARPRRMGKGRGAPSRAGDVRAALYIPGGASLRRRKSGRTA